uniref:Uncharacterized protein n=1 Tax=Ralstonia solanacearum TaxID=305 RepID=A0A0S4WKI7_RALSL|nr:protein of unknown function [Ralstonia solanacearum]
MVDVGRAIVRQPFDGLSSLRGAETLFHRSQHHVTHYVTAMSACGCRPANRFSVAAVQRERYAQRRAIVATEFEAIRAPTSIAPVHGYPTVVSPLVSTHARTAQQQLMLAHDPIDALVVLSLIHI